MPCPWWPGPRRTWIPLSYSHTRLSKVVSAVLSTCRYFIIIASFTSLHTQCRKIRLDAYQDTAHDAGHARSVVRCTGPPPWYPISRRQFRAGPATLCRFHRPLPFPPSTLKSITLARYGITSESWDVQNKCCMPLATRKIRETSTRAWKTWNLSLRYTGRKHRGLGRERSLRRYARSQQDDDVSGHTPDLICSHDFNGHSTKRIREALGIASEGHRSSSTPGHAISPVVSYHRLDW